MIWCSQQLTDSLVCLSFKQTACVMETAPNKDKIFSKLIWRTDWKHSVWVVAAEVGHRTCSHRWTVYLLSVPGMYISGHKSHYYYFLPHSKIFNLNFTKTQILPHLKKKKTRTNWRSCVEQSPQDFWNNHLWTDETKLELFDCKTQHHVWFKPTA